jgi:uncharacterized membrane protein (Fun14 family)
MVIIKIDAVTVALYLLVIKDLHYVENVIINSKQESVLTLDVTRNSHHIIFTDIVIGVELI